MQKITEIHLQCSKEQQEILAAELGIIGYESFWEHENGLSAYIPSEAFSRPELDIILKTYHISDPLVQEMEKKNWNQEWEDNYSPVELDNDVYVRAPFHPSKPGVKHELLIQPKMSFGTGHHETTKLMMRNMLEMDFNDKQVLDMGCGTGILGILASRMGASAVTAIDHEEWAYLNTLENAEANAVFNLKAMQGNEDSIPHHTFDIILSNITRNMNLLLLPVYKDRSHSGTELVLSGFYSYDLDEIKQSASSLGFDCIKIFTENNWVSARFRYL
jgi:ribosomal protein L11 methyltransferase